MESTRHQEPFVHQRHKCNFLLSKLWMNVGVRLFFDIFIIIHFTHMTISVRWCKLTIVEGFSSGSKIQAFISRGGAAARHETSSANYTGLIRDTTSNNINSWPKVIMKYIDGESGHCHVRQTIRHCCNITEGNVSCRITVNLRPRQLEKRRRRNRILQQVECWSLNTWNKQTNAA